MTAECQVDFYLLRNAALEVRQFACRLAAMAWERGHRVAMLVESEQAAEELDRLLWDFPPGRFIPHEAGPDGAAAPVWIASAASLKEGDVVINLSPQPVAEPSRFRRLLEIVPKVEAQRRASREKFRYYRDRGFRAEMHEISE